MNTQHHELPDENSGAHLPTDRDEREAPIIEVRDLGVSFRRNRAARRSFKDLFSDKRRRRKAKQFWPLRNVTFSVRPGEAIGVVGRNGQGKSTLLKLVAGVLLPDEGSVRVRGGVAPLIELTGGFAGDLTVRDNIHLTAGMHGLTRKETAERFDEIVNFAEAAEVLDTPFKHLSSGMKVRVAFSVVSQLDQPVLLVDEVLAVGDRAFREKCYDRIAQLLSEGRTLFLVSHRERDLLRFCTRGLYLDRGKLQFDGPITKVIERYNDEHLDGA